MNKRLVGFVLLANLLVAGTAFAQAPSDSPEVNGAEPTRDTKANAIQFFNRAKDLHEAGKFSEACPLFEESLRLDFGLGALLYLSDCQEQIGRTASAWAGFKEASELAARSGQKERAAIAADRAAKLEPTLSYLRIELAPEHAETKTRLLRNGAAISALLSLDALAVDPGVQEIIAEADGYKPFKTSIEVPKGTGTTTLKIPALEKAPVVAAPQEASGIDGDSMRIAGVVVGGGGLVGIAIGTGFGIDAIKTYDAALATCEGGAPNRCTDEGIALQESAKQSALISTISFAVGGTLVAGGALLYFLAPASEPAPAVMLRDFRVGSDGAYLSLGGVL